MHPFRRLLRGYNSTTYIAQIISEQTSAPVEHTLLTKTKITPRQVKTKNRSERLSNNKGTFAVTKKNIQGSYILIDDVTTTGSTLEEARNILLKHGAMSVIAMTIAH
jgi:predicted amidophosphoribosyltransferase